MELPFLQVFNSHRTDPNIWALVRSPRLARTAASLLGVERVRLYQDSMFYKRPGDGELWLLVGGYDPTTLPSCQPSNLSTF